MDATLRPHIARLSFNWNILGMRLLSAGREYSNEPRPQAIPSSDYLRSKRYTIDATMYSGH